MNKVKYLLLIIFIASGCSTIKPVQYHNQDTSSSSQTSKKGNETPDRVDLNLNNQPVVPADKSTEITPQEETVRIGDRGGDVYASNIQPTAGESGENKKLKIALSLGPGIYRAINYVSLLKMLERQNLAPNIITGTDFGAIVAAMYANGMTPEVIEWSFYKYFKEKKKNKPYETDWVNEVDEFFLTKFKNVNIQDTKRKFFLTLYDHNTHKTFYFDKGNIRDLLLLNLRLSNNFKKSKSGQKYSAAFEKEVFNARLLKQLGADFTMAVDVLGSKFDFENSNEFLIGVYGRIAGRIAIEKKEFDYNITLPLGEMVLDSTESSSLYMQKTYDFMLKQTPVILRKMQAKQNVMLHSGNE